MTGIDFHEPICESIAMARPTTRRIRGKGPHLSSQQILRRLLKDYGPITWRPRYDPVSELVFTILSQHTSDINSERAFERLWDHFGSWEAVAEANVEDVAEPIRIGGLAQVKAPRIKLVLNRITEIHGFLNLDFLSKLSLQEAKTWLLALPGVGPKTAAVVLCFALGMPAMAVDTHVYRVSKRLGLIHSKINADEAHDILESMVEPKDVFSFHVCLITHGRKICKAIKPLCGRCTLLKGCPTGMSLEAKK